MSQYPWGAQSPVKRVEAVEKQLTAIEKKKSAAIEAHKVKMEGIDKIEKGLKSDLRQAQNAVEKEATEQAKAAASTHPGPMPNAEVVSTVI